MAFLHVARNGGQALVTPQFCFLSCLRNRRRNNAPSPVTRIPERLTKRVTAGTGPCYGDEVVVTWFRPPVMRANINTAKSNKKRPGGADARLGASVYRSVNWGNEQGTASACSPRPAAEAAGAIECNSVVSYYLIDFYELKHYGKLIKVRFRKYILIYIDHKTTL